jgi:hypothetical protein
LITLSARAGKIRKRKSAGKTEIKRLALLRMLHTYTFQKIWFTFMIQLSATIFPAYFMTEVMSGKHFYQLNIDLSLAGESHTLDYELPNQ